MDANECQTVISAYHGGRVYTKAARCSRLLAAWSGVPHSTENTMSRGHFSWTIAMILLPVQNALATGTSDRGTGHLASFRRGVRFRNVFGMQVDQSRRHTFQPGIHIVPAQVGVARVEIDADRRRRDQVVDAVQAFRSAGILGVGFQADLDAAPFRHESGFLQGVFDQHKIFVFGRPLGLDAFVRVDHRHADFGRDADRQLDVLAMHVGPSQRPVTLQARRSSNRPHRKLP
jgi:hypothetical protein